MALFQRFTINDQLVKIHREEPVATSHDRGLVTLIVGLGNKGKEYIGTRHNTGFEVVDAFAKANDFPKWQSKAKLKAQTTEKFIDGKKIILAKPNTFMNESGQAVKLIKEFYKIAEADILAIHDELDLPFGTVKLKVGGGSAGNNGVKSIISHIGPEFARIRIGIKTEALEKIDPAEFVLAKFTAAEKKLLPQIIAEAKELIA